MQIRSTEAEYLILSPKEQSPYHADIAERFCKLNNIAGLYNKRDKIFELYDSNWTIIGGGLWEIDTIAKKYLRLYGSSSAYGKFDANGLKDKTFSISDLSDYNIEID
ncbi:Janus/Ocnus [Candidatus Magnetoovum chiemensis]|nr:Janus/Ocnus [Candidatus Magnetoovum chiemensis]